MSVVSHNNFSIKSDALEFTVRRVDGSDDLLVVYLRGKKQFTLAELEASIVQLRKAADDAR